MWFHANQNKKSWTVPNAWLVVGPLIATMYVEVKTGLQKLLITAIFSILNHATFVVKMIQTSQFSLLMQVRMQTLKGQRNSSCHKYFKLEKQMASHYNEDSEKGRLSLATHKLQKCIYLRLFIYIVPFSLFNLMISNWFGDSIVIFV